MTLNIEHEVELARNAGVSHPENYPFLLNPTHSNQQGILLVHGFTATPREMRALGEYLCERNFTVLAVRLPGHGTTPEDLAGCQVEDWFAAVERGYLILQQLKLSVSAVGLSTGALLLLQLSLRQQLEQQVLLSPYLQLHHPLVAFAGLLSHIIPFQQRHIVPADRAFYYQRRPLKGIAQLNRLRQQVSQVLEQITTPTLVLTGKGDKTIYPGSAVLLYNRLGCADKQLYCYGDTVPHVMTTGENPCQIDVFARTADFLAVGRKQNPALRGKALYQAKKGRYN